MGKTISVDIDVCDVLRMMSDSDIKKEADSRDIEYNPGQLDQAFADGMDEGYVSGREAAISAINQIRTGKHSDAIVTLERAFLPRWQDSAECEARYREAMGVDDKTTIGE